MHIGLIPDGNRRYMEKYKLGLEEVYSRGVKKLFDFAEWSFELGVDTITVYALSLENIENRSKAELRVLFDVFTQQAKDLLADNGRLHENEVKINICGDEGKIMGFESAAELVNVLHEIVGQTKQYDRRVLNLAIGYGSKQEIMNAIYSAISRVDLDEYTPFDDYEEITEKYLWVKQVPDLVIRTGGCKRLSNFLLWQSAYSEIFFCEKFLAGLPQD